MQYYKLYSVIQVSQSETTAFEAERPRVSPFPGERDLGKG